MNRGPINTIIPWQYTSIAKKGGGDLRWNLVVHGGNENEKKPAPTREPVGGQWTVRGVAAGWRRRRSGGVRDGGRRCTRTGAVEDAIEARVDGLVRVVRSAVAVDVVVQVKDAVRLGRRSRRRHLRRKGIGDRRGRRRRAGELFVAQTFTAAVGTRHTLRRLVVGRMAARIDVAIRRGRLKLVVAVGWPAQERQLVIGDRCGAAVLDVVVTDANQAVRSLRQATRRGRRRQTQRRRRRRRADQVVAMRRRRRRLVVHGIVRLVRLQCVVRVAGRAAVAARRTTW